MDLLYEISINAVCPEIFVMSQTFQMGFLDFKRWFKDIYSSSFQMAQSFLGLRVSLSLNTGLSLEGKVSHIDSNTQLLTLSDGE